VAIKPAINPSVGVAERPASIGGAMNFISGGSPLGTSIVSSAANKIVGFQRGAAAVAPKVPDLGSIIKTLSTNILNNVESKVQGINQNVQQFITNKFQSQQEEYKQKLQGIDSDMPNKILENFLKLYNQAIGYIQFLGDRRNVKKLGDNLKALQEVFSETFQVARTIRQTIVRIVEQLSNLPKASPGGSGIDVDVKVPGGPLRRSMPSRAGMLKMIGMAGAVGGAGMLGSRIVSGMLDAGDGSQVAPVQTETGEGLTGPLLERFNAILDRFDKAIQNLASRGGGTSPAKPGKSQVTQPEPTPTPSGPGAPSPSATGPGAQGPAGTATRSLLDTIAYAEGTSQYANQGYNTHFGGSQTADLSKHPDKVIRSGGYASAAFGRYQFMPGTWASVGGGAMTPERQDAGAVRLTIKRLNQAGIKVKDETELESLLQKEGLSPRVAAALSPEWASFPTATGASYYGQPVKKLQGLQKVYAERLKAQGASPSTRAATTTTPPVVTPAATQSTTQQQLARSVSQPAATQSKPQVNVVPMNMSSPQSQSTPVGSQVAAPPILSKGGASTPFLTSTNHDNFLTLYSKVVYNLVD